MINRGSVRVENKERFKKCIMLRKQGLSYGEIRKRVPVAKSTLNNWLTLAGLTLTKQHLEIQLKKRIENRKVGTEASRITRKRKRESEIQKTNSSLRQYFKDSLFITGIILYEAEGSKQDSRFSNSDYRLIITFIKFIEKYFKLSRKRNMKFSIFLHETRRNDLEKIKGFWSKKLGVPSGEIVVRWKKHKITNRRNNPDYVGQMMVRVSGESYMARKLLAISDIILRQHTR